MGPEAGEQGKVPLPWSHGARWKTALPTEEAAYCLRSPPFYKEKSETQKG